MILARDDRRVLGAVRFLDATTRRPIAGPLDVHAEGVRWTRSRTGYCVITAAPSFGAHVGAFPAPPGDTPLGSVPVTLTVRDPAGRYLARRRTIRLPRDPDPTRAGPAPATPPDYDPAHDSAAGSLFVPVDVLLFPAPWAPTAPGWAVVRGAVRGSTPGSRLAGALVRVVRAGDGAHLVSALSDARGEVLVAVAGIPVTTWTHGHGPVVTHGVDVTLDVVHDPAAGELPDPYDLERRRASLLVRRTPTTLMSGQEVVTAL